MSTASLHHTHSLVKLARVAILISLSVVGAMIRIPSPLGTVALDAVPAFLAAFAFTLPEAIIVGIIGHLATAAFGGFPLSLPVHIVIAVAMGCAVALAGWLARRANLWVGVVVGLVVNGIVMPLALVPLLGWGIFVSMVVPLLIGAAVNIVLAVVIAQAIRAAGLADQPR